MIKFEFPTSLDVSDPLHIMEKLAGVTEFSN